MPSKRLFLTSLCALLVALAASHGYAITTPWYEYDWSSNTSGFSGKIFFDAPSNSNGSLSDIDLGNSFIGMPDGTYHFTDTFTPLSLTGTLSWSASSITSMNISGASAFFIFAIRWTASTHDISDEYLAFGIFPVGGNSDHGNWVAAGSQGNSVPDTGSTLACLLLSSLILFSARNLVFRTRATQS
jgi:hypothetical protein